MVERVRKALAARLAMGFEEKGTTAYRLFSDPACTIDRFGPVALLQVYEETFDPAPVAAFLVDSGLGSVYRKRFVKDRTRESATFESEPLAGVASEPEIAVLENGLKFLIRPFEGYSPGLFLDQRENRKFLATLVRGGEWLNGFSYTCGFSVYLARAGAKVTSVDLSKKYLDWGRRNFAANGLSESGHRFFAEDCVAFLRKEVRRGRRYEGIVLDPPSFGRHGGKAFSLKQHLREIVDTARGLTDTLFVSCNHSEMDEKKLRALFGDAQFRNLPEVPPDFRGANPLSAVLAVRA